MHTIIIVHTTNDSKLDRLTEKNVFIWIFQFKRFQLEELCYFQKKIKRINGEGFSISRLPVYYFVEALQIEFFIFIDYIIKNMILIFFFKTKFKRNFDIQASSRWIGWKTRKP